MPSDRSADVDTMNAAANVAGVTGWPRLVLRLEGAALLIAATILYATTGASWWLYFALFLAPDVSMAGYLSNPRLGAALYNAAHSTIGPLALALLGLGALLPTWTTPLALIWAAHIGLDRAIGFGLKYGDSIKTTHLGRAGTKLLAM